MVDLPSFSITNMLASFLNSFVIVITANVGVIGIAKMNVGNDGVIVINGASNVRREKVA